jgi:hypothetical protein
MGFPHVFAKIDEKKEKIIKEGAKNALNQKRNLPIMLLLFWVDPSFKFYARS